MRRLLSLFVAAGVFLLAGCGVDHRAIVPTEVPPAPKHPPVGAKAPAGDGRANKPVAAPPVKP